LVAPTKRYRGVCWHKSSKMWTPMIKVHKKNTTLGYFKNEVDAARKYDDAARPLGRPVNFPGLDGGSPALQPPPLPTTAAAPTAHAAAQAAATAAGLADARAVGPPAALPVASVVAVPAVPAAPEASRRGAPVVVPVAI